VLPRLVFFMNPYGQPCQIQDRVLQEMAAELRGRVDVVYFRTNDRNDLVRFEQFGIRSLPALVLTDAAGRELRRATPGIQSAEQVRRLVQP
jgi:thioredoxin 1